MLNRAMWVATLRQDGNEKLGSLPSWSCSSCENGFLRLRDQDRFDFWDDAATHEDGEIELEYLRYYFTVQLICSACGNKYQIAGEGQPSPERVFNGESYEESGKYFTEYVIKTFYPAPHIIDIPENTPLEIRIALKQAFSLYWIDEASCANKLRVAIELILDEKPYKITREKDKGGELFLHGRLEKIKESHREDFNMMTALKLLGNTGSHELSVLKKDILDGFEVIEFILSNSYGREYVLETAGNLSKKHKPNNK